MCIGTRRAGYHLQVAGAGCAQPFDEHWQLQYRGGVRAGTAPREFLWPTPDPYWSLLEWLRWPLRDDAWSCECAGPSMMTCFTRETDKEGSGGDAKTSSLSLSLSLSLIDRGVYRMPLPLQRKEVAGSTWLSPHRSQDSRKLRNSTCCRWGTVLSPYLMVLTCDPCSSY